MIPIARSIVKGQVLDTEINHKGFYILDLIFILIYKV
jgi:hypothetical protein